MVFRNAKLGNLTLTLVIYLLLVLALSLRSEAKGLHLQHRDHVNLRRLIKKRSPQGFDPVIGAGAAAPSLTTSDSTSVTTPTTQSTTSETTSASQTVTSSPTSSLSSSTTTSSSSSTTQISTSSSTSTSTTTSTTSSSPTNEPINVTSSPDTVSAPAPKSTVTQTESVDPTSTPSSIPLVQSGASKTKSTTLTVLIVIGASVAGIAILWTVFRKWKLGRSSKFNERLQPIDWHPTNAEDQRRFSTGASSFQSGGHGGGSEHGHTGSDHGHSYGLPEHDFTAGPATLAPVGGYADLARGSSPQPQMHQVTRGPSLTRPAYDVGVPLHHQTGYSAQDAYGGARF